jgi:FkbM family methyltransferase
MLEYNIIQQSTELFIYNNLFFRKNSWDENIFKSINVTDEYGILGDNDLRSSWPGDIIDIGSHAGFFSYLQYNSGKTNHIYAVEPDGENCCLFRLNLLDGLIKKQITLYERCLSYDTQLQCMPLRELDENTGGRPWIPYNGDTLRVMQKTSPVTHITLDEIIDQAKPPILLKIDCEGCEYDILTKCKNLHKVEAFVGEHHSCDNYYIEILNNLNDFETHVTETLECQGIFAGHKIKNSFFTSPDTEQ